MILYSETICRHSALRDLPMLTHAMSTAAQADLDSTLDDATVMYEQ